MGASAESISEDVPFAREKHAGYFVHSLQCLPSPYQSSDVNRLTLTYFCVTGLDILDALDQTSKVSTSVELWGAQREREKEEGGHTVDVQCEAPEGSLTLDQVDKYSIADWVYSLQVLPTRGAPAGESREEGTREEGQRSAVGGFRGSLWIGVEPNEEGSPAVNHYDGPNIAMTYSALATLSTLGALFRMRIDCQGILDGIAQLQRPNGSFAGALQGGEDDVRFVYCAAAICFMLGSYGSVDVPRTIRFLQRCQTFDGGYGLLPGLEAHGGATYCAVAALYLWDQLCPSLRVGPRDPACGSQARVKAQDEAPHEDVREAVTGAATEAATGAVTGGRGDAGAVTGTGAGAVTVTDPQRAVTDCGGSGGAQGEGVRGGGGGVSSCERSATSASAESPSAEPMWVPWLGCGALPLLHWICQRQAKSGGFQGRRNKEPDTCYAFWLGATLQMLRQPNLPHSPSLTSFLLSCQNQRVGGFSKYPAGHPDILHSFYGVCGLSLAGFPGLKPIYGPLGICLAAAKEEFPSVKAL